MNDPIARFSFDSNKIRIPKGKTKHKINPRLFEPRPNDMTLSVSKVKGFLNDTIESDGIEVGKKRNEDRLYGWAVFPKKVLDCLELTIKHAPPPYNHYNITGWDADRKARKKQLDKVAQHSMGYLLDEPICLRQA